MRTWFVSHGQALLSSLGQLVRAPLATALTILVIAVSLALPLSLFLVVQNLEALGQSVNGSRQLSVLLDSSVDEASALDVLVALEARPEIRRLELVSRDAAAAELKELLGVSDITAGLSENPIPVTLIVEPHDDYSSIEQATRLAQTLNALPEVSEVVLDVAWLKRLEAMTALLKRAVVVMSGLLGFAVLLTVGNTIRLMVLGRADEIEVIDRVGGTAAFVRRPFLYSGLIQGLIGAILAVALVLLLRVMMQPGVTGLADSYGGQFALSGPGWRATGLVAAVGLALGWVASYVAVARHLRRLRPQ